MDILIDRYLSIYLSITIYLYLDLCLYLTCAGKTPPATSASIVAATSATTVAGSAPAGGESARDEDPAPKHAEDKVCIRDRLSRDAI